MTITYPLAMPTTGIAQSEFTLQTNDAVNEQISGSVIAEQIAPEYWDVSMSTSALMRRSQRLRLWTSFLLNMRGAKKVALLYDPDQPYPQAYTTFAGLVRAGGAVPFDGTADVDTRVNSRKFDISNLPASFQIYASDYCGFVKSGRYYLTRIAEDATASLVGACTITVEPALPDMFDAASTVNFLRPYGEFILDPNSVSRPRTVEDGGSISFRARSRTF